MLISCKRLEITYGPLSPLGDADAAGLRHRSRLSAALAGWVALVPSSLSERTHFEVDVSAYHHSLVVGKVNACSTHECTKC
jgi:hypothetical protein